MRDLVGLQIGRNAVDEMYEAHDRDQGHQQRRQYGEMGLIRLYVPRQYHQGIDKGPQKQTEADLAGVVLEEMA